MARMSKQRRAAAAAAEIVACLARLHALERVPRAGWLLRGVAEPESVAAHSHALALLVQLVCDARPGAFDAGTAVAMALVHDTPEVATMDIPMPAGDAQFRQAKARVERELVGSLFGGLSARYRAIFEEFWRNPENFDHHGLEPVRELFAEAARFAGRRLPRCRPV